MHSSNSLPPAGRLAGALTSALPTHLSPLAGRCAACAPVRASLTTAIYSTKRSQPEQAAHLRLSPCSAVQGAEGAAAVGQGSSSASLKSAAEQFVDTLGAAEPSATDVRITASQDHLERARDEVRISRPTGLPVRPLFVSCGCFKRPLWVVIITIILNAEVCASVATALLPD